jgi:Gpi18-like mannosyltransferase
MEMTSLKKHILKVSLIFILIISTVLCVYSIANYKNNNTINQNNQFLGGNQWNNGGTQMPNSQNPPQNMKPSNDINQSNTNRNSQLAKNWNGSASNNNIQQSKNRNTTHTGFNMQMHNNGNMRSGRLNSDSKYSSMLIAYSVIFLIVCTLAYYFFVCKKAKINSDNIKLIIFTLLALGLFFRIFLATIMEGFSGDINLFKNWAMTVANNFSQVYSNPRGSDYPPLYMYVLFLIGKVGSIAAVNPYIILLLKLPSILADITTAYFIYRIARKYLSLEISILLSAFYIFNPAIFIDSAIWGQVDSFFTLMIAIAVFFMSEKKICMSAAMFTAAVLMKPQGIIFLPVLFFELARQKNIKQVIKVAVSAITTAIIIILPFSFNKSPLWIFKLFSSTISEYPYASVNGFNFFTLIGANYKNDTTTLFVLSYHTWGMIFIVMITLFSWFIYAKGRDVKFAFAAALVQIAGVFTFSVGMHERYLFPAVALALFAFVYLKDKRLIILSLGFSVTSYINIYVILFGMRVTTFSPILVVTSLLNVVLFIYMVKTLWDIVVKRRVYEIA